MNKEKCLINQNTDTVSDSTNTQEGVHLISSLNLPIVERVELALILLDLKPATLLDFKANKRTNLITVNQKKIRTNLERAGLKTKLGEKEVFQPGGLILDGVFYPDPPQIRYPLFVAKTLENVEALSKAKTAEEFGKMYGIPDTAIYAFIGKTGFTRLDTIPQELSSSEDYIPFNFVPSQEYWQEEYDLIKARIRMLESINSQLVKEFRNYIKKSKPIKGRALTEEEIIAREKAYKS